MRIKKTAPAVGVVGKVLNVPNNSTEDTYSCDYLNDSLEDIYSTDEVLTNKVWIDGKPIYRKVSSFTTQQDTSFVDYEIGLTGVNFERITKMDIISEYGVPLSWFDKATVDMYIYNKKLRLIPSPADFNNTEWYAIVEYTKTDSSASV